MKDKFSYIILEFKGKIGFLLYKEKFKKNMIYKEFTFNEKAENIYQKMVSIITYNAVNNIEDKITISQLKPIMVYRIRPIGSLLSPLCASRYYPILNFELILIETDDDITDFIKIEREIHEPSIDIGVIKIIDNKGNEEEIGFDLYLN